MAADEEAGRVLLDLFPDGGGVFSGITSNMRDPDIHPLAEEALVEREFHPYLTAVDISVNGFYGIYFFQFIGYRTGSYIPCVPYFIGLFGIFQDPFVHKSMGIA